METFEVTLELSNLRIGEPYLVTVAQSDRVTVTGTEGLERISDSDPGTNYWEWDGTTDRPSIDLRMQIATENTTQISGAPRIYQGEFRWTVRGFTEDGPVEQVTFHVAGPGVVVDGLAYFGEATVRQETVAGHPVEFVVAENVTADPRPGRVTAALNRTHRALRIEETVHLESVWYVPGMDHPGSTGGDVVDLRPGAPLGTVRHEYVHVQQRYVGTKEVGWFTEGTAEYLASLAGLYAGNVSFDVHYAAANTTRHAEANVVDPSAATGVPSLYSKGERLVAAIDLHVRRATNGQATVVDVLQRVNRNNPGEPLTLSELLDAVVAVSGDRNLSYLRPHLDGPSVPTLPSKEATTRLYVRGNPAGDFDDDGLANRAELRENTSAFAADSDDDGLGDGLEVDWGSDPTVADTDADGLDDGRERTLGTDPRVADTDGDGLVDGAEVDQYGTDPTAVDTDDDGVGDAAEVHQYGTDPTTADTDGDGLVDGAEVHQYGTDPTAVDTDGDGLSDSVEVNERGTDPTVADTDGDGAVDGRDADPTSPGSDTDGDGVPDAEDDQVYSADHDSDWDLAPNDEDPRPQERNWARIGAFVTGILGIIATIVMLPIALVLSLVAWTGSTGRHIPDWVGSLSVTRIVLVVGATGLLSAAAIAVSFAL